MEENMKRDMKKTKENESKDENGARRIQTCSIYPIKSR